MFKDKKKRSSFDLINEKSSRNKNEENDVKKDWHNYLQIAEDNQRIGFFSIFSN